MYIDTQDVLIDTSSYSVQSVTVKTKIPSLTSSLVEDTQ